MKPKHRFFLGIFPPLTGLLLSIPPYIPSLEKNILGIILALFIFGFIFMFLFDMDYVRYEIRSKTPGFFFRFTLVNVVLWGYFFAFIGISTLLFGGGIFGPKFVRAEEFPELGQSIYLYDASFFGKAVSVKVKDPMFPYFSKDLVLLEDAEPNSMAISQEKEWIFISPPSGKKIHYNSLTGQTFKEN